MRRWAWVVAAGLLATVVAGLASAEVVSPRTENRPARLPKLLRGVPLRGATGLRLLVAANPPYLFDVDRGRMTPIAGLPAVPRAALSVLAAGKDAVIWLNRAAAGRTLPAADIYVVRHGTTRAELIGSAWSVAPTADGRGLWLLSFVDSNRCTLREVDLSGRESAAPRSIPCATQLIGGAFGVVHDTDGDSLVELAGGRALLRADGVFAVAGAHVLAAQPGVRLTIIDLRDGARTTLRWPSTVGLDTPAIHPGGRLVAVGFADPAWYGGPRQVSDVWLLDTATHRIRQLPDMPAFVSLKATSMAWTDDGRLVLLADSGGRTLVGVWRPGQKRIATKAVRLPARNSGSDTFVFW